jgi:protein involved in sex pheromone biosynthesis
MRKSMLIAAAAGCFALAACGGSGDDKLGDQVADAAENKADGLDDAADNMSGAAEDATEANADAVRAGGRAKEEAIDDADVDAGGMSNAQKGAIINGQ